MVVTRMVQEGSLCSILAPYRSLSLGTALILNALRNAVHPIPPPPPVPSDNKTNTRASLTVTPRKPVGQAAVHVQVGNDRAKQFYERLGFKESKMYVGAVAFIEYQTNI